MNNANKVDIALAFQHQIPKNAKLSYVVLDFETTGFSARDDEIIEIGLVKYFGSDEVESFNTLVKPDQFVPQKVTSITGITNEDVSNAPRLKDVLQKVDSIIGKSLIVAHNAKFDVEFLRAAYGKYGIVSEIRYVDTLELSRKLFPSLPNHKLATIIQEFGFGETQTHRALDDVHATHLLFEKCVDLIVQNFGIPPYRLEVTHTMPPVKPSKIKPTVAIIDPTGPFYGKSVVFTGELSIDRTLATQMAVNAGDLVKGSVSGKTDYLVVGAQDIAIVGDDGMSGKEEKAYALNEAGKAHIQIIGEDEFMALINWSQNEEEDLVLV